jgi:GNAT superfamily N-acetyltransferase
MITVAPFAWEDWHALWIIRLAQLAEDGIILDPATIPAQPNLDDDTVYEWDFHHIAEVYLSAAGHFWFACYAGQPVGYVGGQDLGGAIELRRMYVNQMYRRLGIGTRLVHALVSHSRQHTIRAIELWTAQDGPGRQLYHICGFRTIAEPGVLFQDVHSKTRYLPSAGEIRMRLDLVR